MRELYLTKGVQGTLASYTMRGRDTRCRAGPRWMGRSVRVFRNVNADRHQVCCVVGDEQLNSLQITSEGQVLYTADSAPTWKPRDRRRTFGGCSAAAHGAGAACRLLIVLGAFTGTAGGGQRVGSLCTWLTTSEGMRRPRTQSAHR